jgi:hypothetical protein
MKRFSLLCALAACVPEATPPPPGEPEGDEWDERLNERVTDYSAALRIAALRLTGELPTLTEIDQVATAADDTAKRAAYETLIKQYMASSALSRQMVSFAKDMLRMADDQTPTGDPLDGGQVQRQPNLDSAPVYLAQTIVENRSYLDLLTATSGTCPTFDATTNAFTAADCMNGAPTTVGLLTHPGVQQHFFGNLAFRRTRWVQETFACTRFPAEMAAEPLDVGGAMPYTGVFPFTSIAGKATGGRVDFLSTTSVICANCHSNMNHIAPLFAHFDRSGQYSADFVVPVPLPDEPMVAMSDYLPSGEGLAWRKGVPVTDMASLGRAMAADPAIAECAVARVWNWAMGKQDIVDGGARVPTATIESQVAAFVSGGHKLRDAMYRAFTSDDFVKF